MMKFRILTNIGVCALLVPTLLLAPIGISALGFSQTKLTGTDGLAGDLCGTGVAISGDTAIIGAPNHSSATGSHGAAYVFVRGAGGWTQQAKLTASDASTGDVFGSSVAISGDTAIVGSPYNDRSEDDPGAAYIFVRSGTTWVEQARITALDAAANDNFGWSVAISGDTVIIGAPHDDVASVNQGSAYIFVRSGTSWTGQEKITALDGAAFDGYGTSVSISGDTVVIGSPYDDVASAEQGSAYVYKRTGTTWGGQAKITAEDGAGNDNFGYSVGISADTVIIGSIYDDIASPNQGSAYIFTRSGITWTGQAKLSASDGDAGDAFGASVAISGDTAIAGTFYGAATAPDQGTAYVFTRSGTTWVERRELYPSDGAALNFFGFSVAISEGKILVGSPRHNVGQNSWQGSAYVFEGSAEFDFDGDGKTDIGIFRPHAAAEWWINRSSNGSTFATQFGASPDRIVPGDFTGDGKVDTAFWRASTGEWFVLRSEDFSYYSFPFGIVGDTPAPADYDGDGKADAAVFRASNATWYIRRSTDGGFSSQQFGANGDVPVAGDYDGDGRSDTAIFRPSNGQWWLNRSTAGVVATTFGASSDKPVQGDYTGDGKTDIAFFRPSTGDWFVLRSENSSYYSVTFGMAGDIPAPGDYDGDGRIDTTVFRPSNATWYSNRSTAGTMIQQFGATGDRPVPNAFVP